MVQADILYDMHTHLHIFVCIYRCPLLHNSLSVQKLITSRGCIYKQKMTFTLAYTSCSCQYTLNEKKTQTVKVKRQKIGKIGKIPMEQSENFKHSMLLHHECIKLSLFMSSIACAPYSLPRLCVYDEYCVHSIERREEFVAFRHRI